jgi:hypothetical protein
LAYLPDVARLEAARTHAYHAADVPSLAVADLAGFVDDGEGAETLAERRLARHPATVLLQSDHPVGSIWHAHQQADVETDIIWRPEAVLVTRPDALVLIHILPDDAAGFARSLFAGQTLGEAAATAVAAHPGFDFGATLSGLAGLGAFAPRCGSVLERNDHDDP